jgi:hypothetical protein
MTRSATVGIGSWGLVALLSLSTGCGGGGGGGPQPPPEPRPPNVTAVRLSESPLPPLGPGDVHFLDVEFDYADPDSDLSQAVVTIDEPGGDFSTTVPLVGAPRSGTGATRLVLDARHVPGTYTVAVEVSDVGGLASAPRTATLQISAGAPAAFAVASLSPASGRPGDVVAVAGVGFVAGDPGANEVTFGSPLARAEVISAAADRLEVIVPRVATTGPVAVRTARGTRSSTADFTVAHAITLAPVEARVVVGGPLQFACLEAGTDAADLVWTLNGQA